MNAFSTASVIVTILLLRLASPNAFGGPAEKTAETFVGWSTNGPAVFARASYPALTNADDNSITYSTNSRFHHYLSGTLNDRGWTNFIAHTNGKDMTIWSNRTHPVGWPTNPPVVTWNTNSLIWGVKGFTALSPSWEVQSGIGQVPVTALTRRHGYARGHGMGPDGFNTNFAGKRVWFVTADNQVIQVTVARDVVRTRTGGGQADYTILLFKEDLPAGVEPLRVAETTNVLAKYSVIPPTPHPLFKPEQTGRVSTEVPPLAVNTWKGGDSGSADLLPMPGELVFFAGRSTSGPSPQMQEDMDQLCRLEHLNPRGYQLQWFDLSSYPSYPY